MLEIPVKQNTWVWDLPKGSGERSQKLIPLREVS